MDSNDNSIVFGSSKSKNRSQGECFKEFNYPFLKISVKVVEV